MLVVIAVLAILAAMLLPTLNHGKQSARGVYCLNNTKQLQNAWLMYADDHSGRVVLNAASSPSDFGSWVAGQLDWNTGSPAGANTNNHYIRDAALNRYLAGAITPYKCPSDTYDSKVGMRNRSMSMNGFIGDFGHTRWGAYGATDYRIFLRMDDFTAPGPADTFVFLDEHPDSINDGFFGIRMAQDTWDDVPASFHNGSCCFSYVDGHSALHKWQDSTTKATVDMVYPCAVSGKISPNDIKWLQAHTTALRPGHGTVSSTGR